MRFLLLSAIVCPSCPCFEVSGFGSSVINGVAVGIVSINILFLISEFNTLAIAEQCGHETDSMLAVSIVDVSSGFVKSVSFNCN